MTNRFLVVFVLLLSLSSCLSGIAVEEETTKPQDEIYPITVEVELPCGAADSKSSFTDDELNRITDLNVFVYHDGSLLEEYSCYFTDMTSLMLSFPYDRNGFNIYMFGNVGKIEAPEDESDISDVFYAARTYEDFKLMGFPLANVFPDHVKGTLATFRLKRLVGQYNIVLRPSAETAQYHVKDELCFGCLPVWRRY